MATYDLRDGIPSQLMTGDILNFAFQTIIYGDHNTLQMQLPRGQYRLEVWGSRSGNAYYPGGPEEVRSAGGYAAGTLTLSAATTAYLTVGGRGTNGAKSDAGGASDIRLLQNSYYYRVLTAGGGGEPSVYYIESPEHLILAAYAWGTGVGGGPAGGDGYDPRAFYSEYTPGKGGTATAGGARGEGNYRGLTYQPAGFGTGGYVLNAYGNPVANCGGGGWYGGGCALEDTVYSAMTPDYGTQYTMQFGGGGGSGFAYSAETAGQVPSGFGLNSSYYLTDTQNKSGTETFPKPTGGTETGHDSAGYIRITVLQGQLPQPTITGVSYPAHGSVRIAFTGVSGATAYKVYDGNGNLLATINGSPYTETGISDDTQYTRKISAYSPDRAESEPTVISFTSQEKLASPTNLKATYAVNGTTITWNAVTGATSYEVYRNGTSVGTVSGPKYADYSAGAGTSFTYSIVAKASGRWDSDPASINTSNKAQLANVTNLATTQTVNSVTVTWTAAPNATSYDVYRDGVKLGSVSGTSYIDRTTQPGTTYRYTIYSKASGYYDSTGASVSTSVNPQLDTPTLIEASQTTTSVTLNWSLRDYGATVTYTLRRDGTLIYQGTAKTYTDTGLVTGQTYTYTLVAAIPGSGYYDSNPASITILVGRDYTTIDRQKDYLKSLRRPYVKLCRLRFLNPNGTTAFALDNNPMNKRSTTFIASGSVSANLQNGQRMSATVTLDNADLEYETAVNKVWFGQEVALDEGLILSNGTEYYRQTGVFVIDNPQEKIDPKTRTVTYRLLDKWAELDGTLGGNLEGTYEVPVGTNIFEPITALLEEDRGNGSPLDYVPPVYTEYYNGMTQELTDGTTAYMTDSPYTLTVSGEGGTVAQVILGLTGMVNAWVGYDNTGRLRIDPSQDDILDTNKPVLWRFTPEETQLLGLAYTVKKEDVYNDYVIVGEMLDDYQQPGGRATNYDPRSDTNVYLIGRKTKYESASGYVTNTQCRDLAEWRLKRASVLQKAVSISCTQMMHIDLNSLVEVVRTDKPGSPIERHLIQGYTRPLAYSGAMTITAVSTADLPMATVTDPWPTVT